MRRLLYAIILTVIFVILATTGAVLGYREGGEPGAYIGIFISLTAFRILVPVISDKLRTFKKF